MPRKHRDRSRAIGNTAPVREEARMSARNAGVKVGHWRIPGHVRSSARSSVVACVRPPCSPCSRLVDISPQVHEEESFLRHAPRAKQYTGERLGGIPALHTVALHGAAQTLSAK